MESEFTNRSGGMKESGIGREGGAEGIDEYTERKNLSIVI